MNPTETLKNISRTTGILPILCWIKIEHQNRAFSKTRSLGCLGHKQSRNCTKPIGKNFKIKKKSRVAATDLLILFKWWQLARHYSRSSGHMDIRTNNYIKRASMCRRSTPIKDTQIQMGINLKRMLICIQPEHN